MMNIDSKAAQEQPGSSDESPSLKRPTIPNSKGSSIHTTSRLGKVSLGKINAAKYQYPFRKQPNQNSANSSNGNTTGITTKEATSGDSQSSAAGGNNSSHEQQENKNNDDDRGGKNSFNALVSKFGGGGKKQTPPPQQKDESNVVSGGYASMPNGDDQEPSSPSVPQSISATDKSLSQPNSKINETAHQTSKINETAHQTNQTTIPSPENKTKNETTAPKSSSPGKSSKKMPSFLLKSKPKQSVLPVPLLPPPQSKLSSANSSEHNTPSSLPSSNKSTKSNNLGGGGSMKRFMKQQQPSKQSQQSQLVLPPPQSSQSQSRQKSTFPSSKPRSQQLPPPQYQSRHHTKSSKARIINPNNNKMYSNASSAKGTTSTTSISKHHHNNMVQPKSHQRLVLEQVAAQYFLNDKQQCSNNNNARYVGVVDYGHATNGDAHSGGGGGSELGNIDENTDYATIGILAAAGGEDSGGTASASVSRAGSSERAPPLPLGLGERCCMNNKDREAVISFLEGLTRNTTDDDDEHDDDGDDRLLDNAKNLSIITTEAASSTTESTKKSAAEQSQDIQRETNIDRILEMASDHLSLGKNDLALQAYRRAMKCAFADVISVKQKLVEVKKRQQATQTLQQQSNHLDSPNATTITMTDEQLTKQQEQQFEFSLLQVASRVADIHNNMGVVHEMNRQYEKARSSYVDALEVYHNTCKRFEEKGDPDVDRTKKNVERMALACTSERERRALHEKATRIAKRVGREKHFAQRKILLREAIATLKKALGLEGETIGLSHPVAASTLIQIGKYHYEMREYDSAVMEIRRAITILRNALGGNHPQVGKNTLLLASIYERHGLNISPQGTSKEDSELELYVDALEPLKATLGEVHPEVGFLYVKIGYLYGKKGDLNLSLLAYKAALKAYGEPSSVAAVAGGGVIHPEVVSIWVRVTEHLTSLKSWNEVLVAGRRALFLLRRSKNTLFQGAAQLAVAATNGNAGAASASIGASSSISSSQPTPIPAATSSKKSHIQITSDTYYDSLFTTLQCLGQAHTSLSNYPLARDACSESLRLAWEMALSSHHNLGTTTATKTSKTKKNEALTNSILQVIRALKRLGKAYLLEKHYTPALECFLPSLELLRSSKEMESTLDCASVLGSLGFLYLKLKKFTESSNFLRECLRLYQRNGVDTNDRETRKVEAWLEMAESREGEVGVTPPIFLEIPTIVFDDENANNFGG
mmetsp:Transcript_35717/g.64326  ORF Transcript_35717/g.64326 Transcript_35717/m.64326 type:complete len:1216 (-) Transcript_35717:167-3814(-)|eukprot:CAMPEP_0201937736 /NCGR_PEP_ID=MMETSP0903-20130614/40086_1 /ASSEMBLY_ACC=CAM_ASM_000552 /TAXON_ID=420261 /ORGANISM="Thalassiosira antarctica, Strain CCMP982" /LENGTH=1215 /DNA_ID=CAMNT_0048478803 /DNA_START=243 /DNA_END=3890 /DNA_ORIENTATION=+